MFTTASKFLFALTGFCVLAAVVWAGATTDHDLGMDTLLGPLTFGWKGYIGIHFGYAVLMGIATVSLALGVFLAAIRGADGEAAAAAAGLAEVPEADLPATSNYWPVVGAFSFAAVVVGLAVDTSLVVVGLVGILISTVEWAVRDWSERASADPEVNRSVRDRIMAPFEMPGLAVIVIVGIVVLVSRMLLALPKVGSLVLFGLVPAVILGIGALIVLRPKISQSVVAGLLVFGALALLVGGITAAVVGERDHGHDEGGDHGAEHTEEGALSAPPSIGVAAGVGNR